MEQIILFLKSNRYANRVFKNVAALKEACRMGWQWLTDRPDIIMKMPRRKWPARRRAHPDASLYRFICRGEAVGSREGRWA